MVRTGADGELRYNGRKIAKCRSWSLNIVRDAIEDSCLGELDRSYIPGMRSGTGSASILYDPGNVGAVRVLNSIFNNKGGIGELEFLLDRHNPDGGFRCNVFVTNVSSTVSVGAAIACEVTFQVTGEMEGRF